MQIIEMEIMESSLMPIMLCNNVKNNKLISKIAHGSSISGSLVFYSTGIIIPLGNGKLKCYDMYNGELLWEKNLMSPIQGKVLVHGDFIYFGCEDQNFYGLNPKTGGLMFRVRNNDVPQGQHVVVNNNILINAGNGRIVMITPLGSLYWEYQGNQDICATPGFQNDTILLPMENGEVDCIAYLDGNKKFSLKLNSPAVAEPIFIANDLLSVITLNGQLINYYVNW